MKSTPYLATCLILSSLMAVLTVIQPVFAASSNLDSSTRSNRAAQDMMSEQAMKVDGIEMQMENDMSDMKQNESRVWGVFAGGQSPDGAIQTMAFYPGVTTIDEGDTVVWALGGLEPHTVSFLSGTQPPAPESLEATIPVPCDSYNGTGVCSSGLLSPGQVFVLTFTKPGVYVYICEIHPGMQGIVVVQPKGTPYPKSQFDRQPGPKLQQDILALQDAINMHHVDTTSGANGTLVFNIAAGVSTEESVNVTLSAKQGENAQGFATLNVTAPGTLQVTVNVTGLSPNSTHPEHIHVGTCAAGGPILYPLNQLTAGSDGTASSVTIIRGPPTLLIASDGWFVNVHTGPTMAGTGSKPISCGDVVYSAAAYMRFIPEFLVVRTGDTVNWTNFSPQAIHTVSFLPAGMKIPGFPSPEALNAFGNNTSYNGTGYYNSGVLLPGQSYALTFTKPGIYTYICIIHDEMRMIGYIEVFPFTLNATTTAAPLIQLAIQQLRSVSPVGAAISQQVAEMNDTVLPAAIGSVALIGIASTMLAITFRKYKRLN